MLSKRKSIQDEEISMELEVVCDMQEVTYNNRSKPMSSGTSKTVVQNKDVRDKWSATAIGGAKSKSSEEDLKNSDEDLSADDKVDNNKGCATQRPSTSGLNNNEDLPEFDRPRKKTQPCRKRKTKDVEKENAMMYNKLLKVILSKARKLFGSDSSDSDSD